MSSPSDIGGLSLEFLGVAEGRVYENPIRVRTLLGSCVAVTLHCPSLGIGGMFHGLLPRRKDFEIRDDFSPYRFVDTGVEALAAAMQDKGMALSDMEAKVFGGAAPLGREQGGVGIKNVRTALNALSNLGVRVATANVGGRNGRRLLFLPHSGVVYVKSLDTRPDSGPDGPDGLEGFPETT